MARDHTKLRVFQVADELYTHFLVMSLGSATEVRYLLGLAVRLGFLDRQEIGAVSERYDGLIRGLQGLCRVWRVVRRDECDAPKRKELFVATLKPAACSLKPSSPWCALDSGKMSGRYE